MTWRSTPNRRAATGKCRGSLLSRFLSHPFTLACRRFCALVGEGALSISCFNEASLSSAMPPKAGSSLHWGRMSLRDDKTKKLREDAVLYVPDASGPAVTVAVAEGADANFVWAFTQKTIDDLKADPVITQRVCVCGFCKGVDGSGLVRV
jgi:hypothetical protein